MKKNNVLSRAFKKLKERRRFGRIISKMRKRAKLEKRLEKESIETNWWVRAGESEKTFDALARSQRTHKKLQKLKK
jgi:hypothetical protein